MRDKRKPYMMVLILIVLFLGLGYAYLNTTLSINGISNVVSNTWNIYWDNVQIKSGSVTGEQVITVPTIDTNKTSVVFLVNLKKPGEYYEFTVDAKNDGSIDAMIDVITKTSVPNYLRYTVTYSDGIELSQNQLLNANSLETYKVRVEYRTDINPSDLPSDEEFISLSFAVTYVQASSNAVERPPVYKYTVSSIETHIGQVIPNGVIQYNTPLDAMLAFNNRNFYLKHGLKNGIVTESYVEFVVTDEMASLRPGMTAGTYSLRGNGASYNSSTNSYNDDSVYYETNKATLLRAFGSTYCEDNSTYFDCSSGNFYANVRSNGAVSAIADNWCCHVIDSGTSVCEIIN